MPFAEIFKINILHGYILQIFIGEIIFFPVLMRRKGFAWRLPVGFVLYAFVSVILTNVILLVVSGFTSFIIFLLSVGLCCFCFKNRFKDVLFCCIGAQLLQNVAHNIENLIYLPLSEWINDVGWFFISVAVMLAVYVCGYFLIVRNIVSKEKIGLKSSGVFGIAVVSVLFCYLMQFLFQLYEIDKIWVTCLPLILCDLLALIVQFGLVIYKNKYEENLRLESIMASENKLYDTYKNSINIINMKAHDLKHFIADIGAGGEFDGLDEIKSAVEKYEQTANTGNKALDVVLTEKTYLCHKNEISFSAMVKGDELAFMRTSDVVSLFGNALDNAIEYEKTVEDKNKRYILLKVYRKVNLLSIHVENYCTEEYEMNGGFPVTTKSDKDNHGFGLKSIRYVAEKYGGNVTVNADGSLFSLKVVIPIPVKTD